MEIFNILKKYIPIFKNIKVQRKAKKFEPQESHTKATRTIKDSLNYPNKN